jgi:hypothetical protein
MAASSIAAALSQVPAGLLVDGARAKRLPIAVSGLLVAVGRLTIVFFPHFATVIAAQAHARRRLSRASTVRHDARRMAQYETVAVTVLA